MSRTKRAGRVKSIKRLGLVKTLKNKFERILKFPEISEAVYDLPVRGCIIDTVVYGCSKHNWIFYTRVGEAGDGSLVKEMGFYYWDYKFPGSYDKVFRVY